MSTDLAIQHLNTLLHVFTPIPAKPANIVSTNQLKSSVSDESKSSKDTNETKSSEEDRCKSYSTSDLKTDSWSETESSENDYESNETILFSEHGYIRDKHLRYTRKGEIVIANALKRNSEPICIKKINKTNISIDSRTHPLLMSEDTFFDFFQSDTHLYFVVPLDFGANLREFVNQCQKYIQTRKLRGKEYQQSIKQILWGLIVAIHNLHKQNVTGLDICAENIFVSHSDFIRDKDGSVMINPMINCKLIDFAVGGMKSEFNTDRAAEDIYYFGEICYFGLLFESLPKEYIQIYGLKTYLRMNQKCNCLVPKSLSLLQGLFKINQKKRLKTAQQVMKHKLNILSIKF